MDLPPLPKPLRTLGSAPAEHQRRTDEWARSVQANLDAFRTAMGPTAFAAAVRAASPPVSLTYGSTVALTVGGSNADGTEDAVARSDHEHELPPFGDGAGEFCEGNDARLAVAAATATHHVASATAAYDWSSTTWAGIHNLATLSDDAAVGISRSNSDYTFTGAGRYVVTVTALHNASSAAVLGMRMRRGSDSTVLAVGCISYSDGGAGVETFSITMIVNVAASDVVTLQYAVSANPSGSIGAAPTIDSQATKNLTIHIYRIGT